MSETRFDLKIKEVKNITYNVWAFVATVVIACMWVSVIHWLVV